MIKVAFDTNIILDAVLNRPEREEALNLMLEVATEEIIGIVSANSIADLYYLCRKGIGDEKAREAIADILAMFDIAVVDGDICAAALTIPMSDYEDAILAVCAQRADADYIVTRDEEFLHTEGCPVAVVRSADILQMLQIQHETYDEHI